MKLKNIAWCRQDGFIACGGEEGLLKVLKLESSGIQVVDVGVWRVPKVV